MHDLIERQAAIDAVCKYCEYYYNETVIQDIKDLPSAQPEPCGDVVSRADVIDMLEMYPFTEYSEYEAAREVVKRLPSAQPDLVRCKDCEYGEQDEVGRWFCRSLGCQIGNEDGSGYCADAERRTND